ncbi:MAG: hypothetical protein V1792_06290 [Pseudomonadota bacterium]
MSTIEKEAHRDLRLLICDTACNVGETSSDDEEWISSPIRCLDRAVDSTPGIIAVRFGEVPIGKREALLELAFALKRNSHTRMHPVLALLDFKHRKLLEDLNRAGVEFAKYIGGITLESNRLRSIIDGLGPADYLAGVLETMCPFLHYNVIDSQQEMTVCGGYLDRLVLGGRWLHKTCETGDHVQCEHYLNPRLEP